MFLVYGFLYFEGGGYYVVVVVRVRGWDGVYGLLLWVLGGEDVDLG